MSFATYLLVAPIVEKTIGVLAVVLYGMLAVWAISSRRHWFLRAVILIAALGPLLLLPAYEFAITIGIAQAIFIAGLAFWQPARISGAIEATPEQPPSRWPRVGLRDLMLFMIVLAAALAMCVNAPRHNVYAWLFTIVDGLVLALMGWGCVWLGWGAVRLGVRLAVAPFILAFNCISSQVWLFWFTYGLTSFSHRPGFIESLQAHWEDRLGRYWATWPGDFWEWAAAVTIGTFVFITWLSFARGAGWFATQERDASSADPTTAQLLRGHPIARRLAPALTIVVIAFMCYVWARLITPAPLPAEAFEFDPNFEELIAVAEELHKLDGGNAGNWGSGVSDAQYAALVARNEPHWRRLRTVIGDGIRFPWEFFEVRRDLLQHASYLNFLFATRATRGDGTGALEPRIEACLDAIRLAAWERRSASRFGRIFDNSESYACRQLFEMLRSLSIDQCRNIIDSLWQIEQLSDPYEVSKERWRRLMQNVNWQNRRSLLVHDWLAPGAGTSFDRVDVVQLQPPMLLTELAIRTFELKEGRLPETMAELVPRYLPEMPQDPFADVPLKFLRTESGYVLYSVGPNGVDDGGQAAERPWLRMDLPSSAVFPPPRTPAPAAPASTGKN